MQDLRERREKVCVRGTHDVVDCAPCHLEMRSSGQAGSDSGTEKDTADQAEAEACLGSPEPLSLNSDSIGSARRGPIEEEKKSEGQEGKGAVIGQRRGGPPMHVRRSPPAMLAVRLCGWAEFRRPSQAYHSQTGIEHGCRREYSVLDVT